MGTSLQGEARLALIWRITPRPSGPADDHPGHDLVPGAAGKATPEAESGPGPGPSPSPATAPAPAPRAASLTSPPPAITHKPKKTPTPQKEPESGLELVGACLRVRSQGWGDGRAWDGQLASGLQTWETWGVGDGAAGRCRKDAARPRPCGSEWVRCVSGNLVGKAAPSVPLPASRRPRRSLKTGTHGPGASNRSETISRSWVSALGEAIRHRLRHRPSLARGWGVALWSGWPVQEPNVLSHSVVCNSVRPHGL